MKEISIDGVTYVPQSERPSGNRAVIVVDRGWIFAGDVEQSDGVIRLSNAVWVFCWESIGFNGMIAAPEKADIRAMPNGVEIPDGSEIFRVPVHSLWGIKGA